MLAGVFDSKHGASGAGQLLETAVAAAQVKTFSDGPLSLVTSGVVEAADDVVLVVDGKLWGLSALSDELGLQGEPPPGRVVAAGYRRWGAGVLERLRGSYALVIWDRRSRSGLITQDHLAQRAIFLHERDGRLSFASEVRDLLPLLSRRPEPDRVAMIHWLAEHAVYEDRTLFAGVRRLLHGEHVTMDLRGWARRTHWRLKYIEPLDISREEAAIELRRRLADALSARGAGRRDSAIILSGGVDSSTVAGVARRYAGGRSFPAYSAIFPDHPEMDESAQISATTRFLGIPSTLIQCDPQGAIGASIQYLRSWQLPVMSPAYMMERATVEVAAADGIRLAFDGQGGDELFGSSRYLAASLLREGRVMAAHQAIANLPGVGAARLSRTLPLLWSHGVRAAMPVWTQRAFRRVRGSFEEDAHPWLLPHARDTLAATEEPWGWKRLGGPLWWSDRAVRTTSERLRWGLPDYLRRRAADSGVEACSALIGDVDLVEFALRIPTELTYTPDHGRAVIRHAISGLVPEEVRLRRGKADFAGFNAQCLTGPDLPVLRRLLAPRDAEIYAYTSRDVVAREFLDKPPGREGEEWRFWLWRVWNLITAECWLRSQADPDFPDTMLSDPSVPLPSYRLVRRGDRPPSTQAA